jgi:preprotein translocase subunit SecY
LFAEFFSKLEQQQGGGLIMFIVEMVVLFFIFMGVILLVQGTRRIPVQYANGLLAINSMEV